MQRTDGLNRLLDSAWIILHEGHTQASESTGLDGLPIVGAVVLLGIISGGAWYLYTQRLR